MYDNVYGLKKLKFTKSKNNRKCNKRARIYIIDQNGDLVKGASDSECATNSANLKIMLNKVENIEATEMYIEPQLHTLVIEFAAGL